MSPALTLAPPKTTKRPQPFPTTAPYPAPVSHIRPPFDLGDRSALHPRQTVRLIVQSLCQGNSPISSVPRRSCAQEPLAVTMRDIRLVCQQKPLFCAEEEEPPPLAFREKASITDTRTNGYQQSPMAYPTASTFCPRALSTPTA